VGGALTGCIITGARNTAKQYVNEFTFQLGDGHCHAPALDRINALFSRMVGKRLTYTELIANTVEYRLAGKLNRNHSLQTGQSAFSLGKRRLLLTR